MIHTHKITPNLRISIATWSKHALISLFILGQISSFSLQGQDVRGEQALKFLAHRSASYLTPENSVASIKLTGEIAFISFHFDAVRQAKAIYPDVPSY